MAQEHRRGYNNDKSLNTIMTRCRHQLYETAVLIEATKECVKVPKPVFKLAVEFNISEQLFLSIRVQNRCQRMLVLRSMFLYYGINKRTELFKGLLRMVPGYEFQFEKQIPSLEVNTYKLLILSQFPKTGCQLREIYSIQFLTPRIPRGPPLKIRKLREYEVPDYVKQVYDNQFLPISYRNRNSSLWLKRYNAYQKEGLTPMNYIEHLKMLNQIDDYSSYLTMHSYRINNAKLLPTDFPKQYLLSTEQFHVPPVLLEVGNFVQAFDVVKNKFGEEISTLSRGYISEKNASFVINMETPLKLERSYKLIFPLNRTQFQMEYQALNFLTRIDYVSLLFPTATNQSKKTNRALVGQNHTIFDWCQEQIRGNALQQAAVKNIINRTAYPAPFILFGPPGTGKTCTIVEAVLQIYKLQPRSRILLTAASNYACNELAIRLLKFVPETDIYRYMSFSIESDINQIDLGVLEISNFHCGKYATPSMKDFENTRIVICTIMTSARLWQLDVRTSMYDYIFIDECGSSKELSALVPITIGTSNSSDSLHASVVLAGDPKQLGPVTRLAKLSTTAQNVSLLERLMQLPFYQNDLNNNDYNTPVMTKLRDNYRSHASLFEFSNRQFYEADLRAKAPSSSTDWAIGWRRLPNPKFPMLFHAIVGEMTQDASTLSYVNPDEAKLVYEYVQELLKEGINGRIISEEDIGIITPYSKQVSYIKKGLSKLGVDKIEVGSAEQYQGREKSVIIISTVRSNRVSVGFLANSKRLNVIMTRAKALTIIVGNPHNLRQDATWYNLLKYLISNEAVTGRDFSLHPFPPKVDISLSSLNLTEFD